MPTQSIGHRFAEQEVRLRWVVVFAWLAATAALVWLIRPVDPAADEPASFLPQEVPSLDAARALGRYFPHNSGLSEATVVFERRAGQLTGEDRKAVERVAALIRRPRPPTTTASDLAGVHVRSPYWLTESPMVSPRTDAGQAALVTVNIPANFITHRSARIVRHVRGILADRKLPEGLSAYVTGSAAVGSDYALAVDRSHDRTLHVTLVAVVIILLVVYRAPAAALIPLAAISLAAVVALRLLELGAHFGMHTGSAEKIFVIVLLYGAGINYSLLLISRCREFLAQGLAPREATAAGLAASMPAILASAGTDTLGLLMLSFAKFGIFQTTGPAVATALVVALLSAITLVPALVCLAGTKLFWPMKSTRRPAGQALWTRVARLVTAKAGLVLGVTVVLLAVPAVQGARLRWVYDTLTSLGDDYGSVTGTKTVVRHWPIGELAPVNVLLRADKPIDADTWHDTCDRITRRLHGVPGVSNVRSLSQPLGKGHQRPAKNRVRKVLSRLFVRPITRSLWGLNSFAQHEVHKEYLSTSGKACRLAVVLDRPGLSLGAMDAVAGIRQNVTTTLAAADVKAKVLIGGVTAEMIDVRTVTHGDFYRIAAMVLGVIFVMVLVLLRDAILSAFMVASTVLSYLATLGLTYWFFAACFGADGLDWKVEVFLFVVMVAVGQDYNIFLAARLAEEGLKHPPPEATRLAVSRTGPVISSCGVIMAATLGSLMACDLMLLVQLGFALSLGMLIDTFIVRPLLLPAFAVLTGRTGKSARIRG